MIRSQASGRRLLAILLVLALVVAVIAIFCAGNGAYADNGMMSNMPYYYPPQ